MKELANYSNLIFFTFIDYQQKMIGFTASLTELYLQATVIPTTVLSGHKGVIGEPRTPPEKQTKCENSETREDTVLSNSNWH